MNKQNTVINLGCRLNAHESGIIKDKLSMMNLQNVIVCNTCAVTKEAERQSRQAIRKAKRSQPDATVVVTGCAAHINPDQFQKMPEVSIIIDNDSKMLDETYKQILSYTKEKYNDNQLHIAQNINYNNLENQNDNNSNAIKIDANFNNNKKSIIIDNSSEKINEYSEREDINNRNNNIKQSNTNSRKVISYSEERTRAFVQIQNGCDHRCTFCIIPYGRGNSRSICEDDIIENVQQLVNSGHNEIVFTGVDITDYGKGLTSDTNLGLLCKKVLYTVPNLARLRLSSIDVAEVDNHIIDLLKSEPRFMPHLHLSLQSGDDMILKRMKRRHNRAMVIDFCNMSRTLRPDITFGSDIIAGFPTETDVMFENTLFLLDELNIIHNHIFTYSARPDTPASRMPQVPIDIRKIRANRLISQTNLQLSNFLKTLIGSSQSIIIEQSGIGRAENFSRVIIKESSENHKDAGSIVKVKIIDSTDKHLIGELI